MRSKLFLSLLWSMCLRTFWNWDLSLMGKLFGHEWLGIFWYPQETAFDRKISVRLNFRNFLLDMRDRDSSNCAKLTGVSGSVQSVCLLCAHTAFISHHFLWDSLSKTSHCEVHASASSSCHHPCSAGRADQVELGCQKWQYSTTASCSWNWVRQWQQEVAEEWTFTNLQDWDRKFLSL